MKHFLMAGVILILALGGIAQAQSSDDQYIRIYNLIQQADDLNQSGQRRAAYEKYQQAQTALKSLSVTFPEWNPNLVKFRLDYIQKKLAQFGPVPSETPATPPATNAVEQPVLTTNLLEKVTAVPPAAVNEMQNRITALADENRRLAADKAALDAKLREALAVQPATVDPRELAKAETTIRNLQKDNALLQVSLEQAQAKLKRTAEPAALTAAKKALVEANEKIAQQSKLISALNEEKRVLQSHTQAPAGSAQVKELKAENAQLKKRVKELESQVKTSTQTTKMTSPAESDKQIRKLVQERDELQKKLAAANQNVTKGKGKKESDRVQQLTSQLTALQAKLDALESKKVPYTPEELALFKAPPPQTLTLSLSSDDKPADASRKSGTDVPVGAGALVAEAHRAFEAGRYDEAEQKFKQVLAMDEKNVSTLGNLATIAIQREQIGEAENYLKQALAVDPNDAVNLSLWGIVKFKQEKYDDALEALSKAAKLDPKNPETQNYLGITLSQKGQRDAAEAALRKAIQLAPDYGSAHQNLAVVYATQNPPFMELARYHYRKALECGQKKNPSLEAMLDTKK